MRRHLTSVTLMICGGVLVAMSAGTMLMPGGVWAMPARQPLEPPPERPSVEPLPGEPEEPGEPGEPGDGGDGGGGGGADEPTPFPTGRITGTVIDQSTGAPVPGVEVLVGGVVVRTNADGNYERAGLLPGQYVVRLSLPAEQGIPAQAPQAVVIGPDDTEVVHLFFSPAPTPFIPTATAVPTATLVPPLGAQPPAAPLPGQLPVTSVDAPAEAASSPARAEVPVPSRLPVTAEEQPGRLALVWLVLGIALAGAGIALQCRPEFGRRLAQAGLPQHGNGNATHRDSTALLRKLLATGVGEGTAKRTQRREEATEVLRSLLEDEV